METQKRSYDILSAQLRALCRDAEALTDGTAHELLDDHLQQIQKILEKHLHPDAPPQALSEEK